MVSNSVKSAVMSFGLSFQSFIVVVARRGKRERPASEYTPRSRSLLTSLSASRVPWGKSLPEIAIAGSSTVEQADETLKRSDVQQEIELRRDALLMPPVLTRDSALSRLTAVAMGDDHKLVIQAIAQLAKLEGWEAPTQHEVTVLTMEQRVQRLQTLLGGGTASRSEAVTLSDVRPYRVDTSGPPERASGLPERFTE